MGRGTGSLLGLGPQVDAGGVLDVVAGWGAGAMSAFWLPLLIWTVWAAAGLWALERRGVRGSTPLHPGDSYRVGQILVFMLPVLLLARALTPDAVRSLGVGDVPFSTWVSPPPAPEQPTPVPPEGTLGLNRTLPMDRGVPAAVPSPRSRADGVSAPSDAGGVPAPAYPDGGGDPTILRSGSLTESPVLAWLSVLGLVLAGAMGAVATGNLVVRFRELGRVKRLLEPVGDGELRKRLESVAEAVGLGGRIDWRVGPPESVPMTFGVRRPVVALPPGVLSDAEATALALHHELIHVKRHDFAWALSEGFLAALFSFHPLLQRLVRFVGDARERSCDLEVVAATRAARRYGELLIHLADRPGARLLVAAGLSPTSSKLKERLETVSRFNAADSRGPATYGLVTAATGLAIAFVAACAGDPSEAPVPEADMVAESFTTRFGPMSDETREEALQRLDLQVNYLIEQMDGIEAEGVFSDHASARYQLLKSMYVERLEHYETLRMEAEVNRQLGVS